MRKIEVFKELRRKVETPMFVALLSPVLETFNALAIINLAWLYISADRLLIFIIRKLNPELGIRHGGIKVQAFAYEAVITHVKQSIQHCVIGVFFMEWRHKRIETMTELFGYFNLNPRISCSYYTI